MVQIFDIAILIAVVYAIYMPASSSAWSYCNVGKDVKLFFFAVGAVWAAFRFRSKQSQADEGTESAPIVEPAAIKNDAEFLKLSATDRNESDDLKFIYKCAWERNIGGAISTFRSMKDSGFCLSPFLFNTMLQAFVNCGNIQAAEDWMDEITEAGKADETSFNVFIKALVTSRTLDKASNVMMKDMKSAGVPVNITVFSEVLGGLVRESHCTEAFALFDQMESLGLKPTSSICNSMTKLINASRNISQSIESFDQIFSKYTFEASHRGDTGGSGACISSETRLAVPVPSPVLAAVISQASHTARASCAHEIRLSGNWPQMKAARRTLQQLGFLKKAENSGSPLDGHWETDQGFTVVIEGKIVRWSERDASRLRYTRADRRACVLTLYGEASNGQLVHLSDAPNSLEVLKWDNGDVWYPCDGRAVGQRVVFSQTMTKTLRDTMQDKMSRARAGAVLKRVSTQGLHMPSVFEDAILQFLGNDLYYISVRFESRWNPSLADDDGQPLPKASEDFLFDEDEPPMFEASQDSCVDGGELPFLAASLPSLRADQDIGCSISRRHPHIGLRHCWADRGDNSCGQRTWVNGEDLDDQCFCRHIGAVTWA